MYKYEITKKKQKDATQIRKEVSTVIYAQIDYVILKYSFCKLF